MLEQLEQGELGGALKSLLARLETESAETIVTQVEQRHIELDAQIKQHCDRQLGDFFATLEHLATGHRRVRSLRSAIDGEVDRVRRDALQALDVANSLSEATERVRHIRRLRGVISNAARVAHQVCTARTLIEQRQYFAALRALRLLSGRVDSLARLTTERRFVRHMRRLLPVLHARLLERVSADLALWHQTCQEKLVVLGKTAMSSHGKEKQERVLAIAEISLAPLFQATKVAHAMNKVSSFKLEFARRAAERQERLLHCNVSVRVSDDNYRQFGSTAAGVPTLKMSIWLQALCGHFLILSAVAGSDLSAVSQAQLQDWWHKAELCRRFASLLDNSEPSETESDLACTFFLLSGVTLRLKEFAKTVSRIFVFPAPLLLNKEDFFLNARQRLVELRSAIFDSRVRQALSGAKLDGTVPVGSVGERDKWQKLGLTELHFSPCVPLLLAEVRGALNDMHNTCIMHDARLDNLLPSALMAKLATSLCASLRRLQHSVGVKSNLTATAQVLQDAIALRQGLEKARSFVLKLEFGSVEPKDAGECEAARRAHRRLDTALTQLARVRDDMQDALFALMTAKMLDATALAFFQQGLNETWCHFQSEQDALSDAAIMSISMLVQTLPVTLPNASHSLQRALLFTCCTQLSEHLLSEVLCAEQQPKPPPLSVCGASDFALFVKALLSALREAIYAAFPADAEETNDAVDDAMTELRQTALLFSTDEWVDESMAWLRDPRFSHVRPDRVLAVASRWRLLGRFASVQHAPASVPPELLRLKSRSLERLVRELREHGSSGH
ncbi:MAG: hypothetical protein MHM6MM_003939 [Cercozoa sp. M6MM]